MGKEHLMLQARLVSNLNHLLSSQTKFSHFHLYSCLNILQQARIKVKGWAKPWIPTSASSGSLVASVWPPPSQRNWIGLSMGMSPFQVHHCESQDKSVICIGPENTVILQ